MNFEKMMHYEKIVDHLEPYTAFKLTNGVIITVFDGYAIGSDGKTYHHVGRENGEEDLIMLGWSCDVDKNVILQYAADAALEERIAFENSSF